MNTSNSELYEIATKSDQFICILAFTLSPIAFVGLMALVCWVLST